MRHDHVIDGYAFRLRPATFDDAEFVMALRKNQKYLREGAQTLEEQKAWMRNHHERPDDYYFIVEARSKPRPVGTLRVVASHRTSTAMFESFAVLPDSLAAAESLLLACRFVFTTLNLDVFEALAMVENHAAISTYKSIGARTVEEKAATIGNRKYKSEVLALAVRDWERTRRQLEELSMRAAKKLS